MTNVCSFRLAFLSACFILAGAEPSLVIQPPKLVVEYGTPASANCSTKTTHNGMGWEASEDPVPMKTGVQHIIWRVKNLTHFDIKPLCYINSKEKQEELALQVTVYKIPDIFIKITNHQGPLIEGRTYLLQCDIIEVAPIQNLTVTWYKNDSPEDWVTFSDSTRTPVSTSLNLQIQPKNDDDGAIYWCEAKLELGPEEPPPKKSNPLYLNVNYKPRFLREVETIDCAGTGDLNCTAVANPPPNYTWHSPSQAVTDTTPVISIQPSSGNYTCSASNKYGKATKFFIIDCHRTTFWTILGIGLALAAVLVVGYIVKEMKTLTPNKSKESYPGPQTEELTELKD